MSVTDIDLDENGLPRFDPRADNKLLADRILERLTARRDREFVDAIGTPLRSPEASFGTFTNAPSGGGMTPMNLTEILHTFGALRGRADLGDGVQVQLFSIQVTDIEVVPKDEQTVTIEVSTLRPDRDAPLKTIGIKFSTDCPRAVWEDPMSRLRMVRECIRRTVLHEVDENLYLNGKRQFDPHLTAPVVDPLPFGDSKEDSLFPFKYTIPYGSRGFR